MRHTSPVDPTHTERLNLEALETIRGSSKGPNFSPPQRSLLGEILDWMLAPLFLIWPMSVAITYVVAQNIANVPYDHALANNLQALARQVSIEDGRAVLTMSDAARAVYGPTKRTASSGWFWAAERNIWAAIDNCLFPPQSARKIQYEDETLRGFTIRLAFTWIDQQIPGAQAVLLIVAETNEKRTQLANDIIKGVIIPQFAVLPIAVLLVWFGLSRCIAPLNALQHRLHACKPDDLSPIDERAAPSEITPLVAAMNNFLNRLSASVDAQRRFVADAAHQLKTPLACLRTQAELALRNATPEEMQASLGQLVTVSEPATRLINQLLLLARAETPSPKGFSDVEMNGLAQDKTLQWMRHALQLNTDLGFEEAPNPVWIHGNAILLAELLNNLIDNALRYTPPGGQITIRVSADVEDTGPGIAIEERERVFNRFYRVLGASADGSGLGLAIVREIVQKHQAGVQISTNPNSPQSHLPGTRIRTQFPLASHVCSADSPSLA